MQILKQKIKQLYATIYFGTSIAKTINLSVEVKRNDLLKVKLENWTIVKYFDCSICSFFSCPQIHEYRPHLQMNSVFHNVSSFDKITKLREMDKGVLFTDFESTFVMPLQQNP